jgi:hypothetical protein
MLNNSADTTHETAEEWYESYGGHIATSEAGDVVIQSIGCDWLDEADDSVVDLLMASKPLMTIEEAYCLLALARSAYDIAVTVCGLLDDAVEAYHAGDIDEVRRALSDARAAELEAGDAPATQSLWSQLLRE